MLGCHNPSVLLRIMLPRHGQEAEIQNEELRDMRLAFGAVPFVNAEA